MSVGVPPHLYPVAVLEDRYGGTYSGGAWIALALVKMPQPSALVLHGVVDERDAWGDDIEAAEFWGLHRDYAWIAVGNTPDEAMAALIAKAEAPR